jgi:hypothetical protein
VKLVERRERTQLLFSCGNLWHFLFSFADQSAVFCFSDERISFPFVSLIDFCNNFSSLLHISSERDERQPKNEKANEILPKRLWSRKMGLCEGKSKQQSESRKPNGKNPSEFNLINSFTKEKKDYFSVDSRFADEGCSLFCFELS